MKTLLTSKRTRNTPAGAVVRDQEVKFISDSEFNSGKCWECPSIFYFNVDDNKSSRIGSRNCTRRAIVRNRVPSRKRRICASWQSRKFLIFNSYSLVPSDLNETQTIAKVWFGDYSNIPPCVDVVKSAFRPHPGHSRANRAESIRGHVFPASFENLYPSDRTAHPCPLEKK